MQSVGCSGGSFDQNLIHQFWRRCWKKCKDESAKLKAEMLHYLIVHAENRINKMCYHIIMPLTQPVLHTEQGQELVNRWALGSNRKLKSWNFSAAFLQPTTGATALASALVSRCRCRLLPLPT